MRRRPLGTLLRFGMAIAAVQPLALAQRNEATTAWQKRNVVIDYGAVRVGKHTISELALNTPWRMGNNTASTLRTETPLFSAGTFILPGSYRVTITRRGDDHFTFDALSGGFGLGTGDDASIAGKFAQIAKPNDKLTLEWRPPEDAKDDGANKAMSLKVQFGTNVLTIPVVLLGGRPADASGFAADVFTVPFDVVTKRRSSGSLTPIATVRSKDHRDKKAPLAWNLLLGKETATLQPQGVAPTDSYGFGAVEPPDAAYIRKGTAKWSDAPAARKAEDFLTLDKFERTKDKQLHFIVVCGDQIIDVEVPDPLTSESTHSTKG